MQECDSKLQLHGHFGAWIFRFSERAFGNAVCSFPYAVNLEMDDSLKWVLFNVKKKAISLITTPSLSINNSIKLRVPRNGVVPGEVQFAKNARFFCFFCF